MKFLGFEVISRVFFLISVIAIGLARWRYESAHTAEGQKMNGPFLPSCSWTLRLGLGWLLVGLFLTFVSYDVSAQQSVGTENTDGQQYAVDGFALQVGDISVYKSQANLKKFLYTVPLHLQSYEIVRRPEKLPIAILKYSPHLLKEEKDRIVKGLNSTLGGAGLEFTEDSLSPIKFNQLTVVIKDVDGKSMLGKYELPPGSYAIRDFDIRIELDSDVPVENESKLIIEERMITQVLNVKVQSVALRVLYEIAIDEIEKVTGTGDVYLTRNALRSFRMSTRVRKELFNLGARPEDFEKLLIAWETAIQQPVNDDHLFDIAKKSVIWTPSIGRLEIQPTVRDYLTQKETLINAIKSKTKQEAEKVLKEAKDAGTLEKWYILNHERGNEAKRGSGQFKTQFDMISLLGVKTDGTAALAFEKSWDNLNKDESEKSQYDKAWKNLKEKTLTEMELEQYAQRTFEGENKIFSTEGKLFNLYRLNDMRKTVELFLSINNIVALGATPVVTSYLPRSLGTAIQVRNDIADLQKQVKELQANLAVAVKGLEGKSLKVGLTGTFTITGYDENDPVPENWHPSADVRAIAGRNTFKFKHPNNDGGAGVESFFYKIGKPVKAAWLTPDNDRGDYFNSRYFVTEWIAGYLLVNPQGDGFSIGGSKQQKGRFPVRVVYLYTDE